MRCFCGTSAALVNVIQDNVDEKVRWIIDTCSFDSKATKILSEAVPTIELAKVDVVDFKGCDVLESEQRHGCVERKLFVPCDQASFVVWSQSQTWNFGECRVQVPQILLEQCFLLLSLGYTVRSNTQARPKG